MSLELDLLDQLVHNGGDAMISYEHLVKLRAHMRKLEKERVMDLKITAVPLAGLMTDQHQAFIDRTVAEIQQGVYRVIRSQQPLRPNTIKTDFVRCPICGESDMRREFNIEGQSLISCVNHDCGSNGGTNYTALTADVNQVGLYNIKPAPEPKPEPNGDEPNPKMLAQGKMHSPCCRKAFHWNQAHGMRLYDYEGKVAYYVGRCPDCGREYRVKR